MEEKQQEELLAARDEVIVVCGEIVRVASTKILRQKHTRM